MPSPEVEALEAMSRLELETHVQLCRGCSEEPLTLCEDGLRLYEDHYRAALSSGVVAWPNHREQLGQRMRRADRTVRRLREHHGAEIRQRIRDTGNMVHLLRWARQRFDLGLLEARLLVETPWPPEGEAPA